MNFNDMLVLMERRNILSVKEFIAMLVFLSLVLVVELEFVRIVSVF